MTAPAFYAIVSLAVKILAGMAQLVEQRIRNAQVVGSSPTTSSKKVRMQSHAEPFFVCSSGHGLLFIDGSQFRQNKKKKAVYTVRAGK